MAITDSHPESSYLTGLTCNVMLEFILADEMADIPPSIQCKASWDVYYGMLIWQPLWILEVKVGICFYFSIIRVVISQLAL